MAVPADRLPPEENAALVDSVLAQAKSRVMRISLAAAGCGLAAGTLLFLLGFVIADHVVKGGVTPSARVAFMAVYVAAVAAGAVIAVILPAFRRINDLYAARLIERSHGGLHNSLVNAIQLERHRELPGSLRAALIAQAAADAARADVQRAVAWDRLRQASFILAGVVLAFCVYSLVAPKSVRVSVLRAFGLPLAAPTRTIIVHTEPADGASVLIGRPVTFTARLGGRMPGEAFVDFAADGGTAVLNGQRLSLLHVGESDNERQQRIWQGTKAGADLQQTMRWRLVAGDAVSPWRRLIVRPAPDVTDLRITCTYPAYTGLAPTATSPGQSANVDAVVGTQVAVEAGTNVPARDPVLVVMPGADGSDETRLSMQETGADGRMLRGHFTVLQDGQYCVRFCDLEGVANQDPIRHSIRARPDAAPTVSLATPPADVTIRPDEPVPIRAAADDDYGITRLAIEYRHGSAAGSISLPLPAPAADGRPAARSAERHAELDFVVRAAQFGARPGETVEWQIAAWDNREDFQGTPAPQKGLSAIRRITITIPEPLAKAAPPETEAEPPVPDSRPTTKDAGSQADEPVAASEGQSPDAQQLALKDPAEENELDRFLKEHQEDLAKLREHLGKPDDRPVEPHKDSNPAKEGPDKPTDARDNDAKKPPDRKPAPASAPNKAEPPERKLDRQDAPSRSEPKKAQANQTGQEPPADERRAGKSASPGSSGEGDPQANAKAKREPPKDSTAERPADVGEQDRRAKPKPGRDAAAGKPQDAAAAQANEQGKDAKRTAGKTGQGDPEQAAAKSAASGDAKAGAAEKTPQRHKGEGGDRMEEQAAGTPGNSGRQISKNTAQGRCPTCGRPKGNGPGQCPGGTCNAGGGQRPGTAKDGQPGQNGEQKSGEQGNAATKGQNAGKHQGQGDGQQSGQHGQKDGKEPGAGQGRNAGIGEKVNTQGRPTGTEKDWGQGEGTGIRQEAGQQGRSGGKEQGAGQGQEADKGRKDDAEAKGAGKAEGGDGGKGDNQRQGDGGRGKAGGKSKDGDARGRAAEQADGGSPSRQGDDKGQGQAEAKEDAQKQGAGKGEGKADGVGKEQAKDQTEPQGQDAAGEQAPSRHEQQAGEKGQGAGQGRNAGQQGAEKGQGRGKAQGNSSEGKARGEGTAGDQAEATDSDKGQNTGQNKARGSGEGDGRGDADSQGGQGIQPGQGGRSGAAHQRVDSGPDRTTAPDGLILPSASKDREAIDTAGAVLPVIDALERQLRNKSVDPKLLEELHWDETQADAFVKQYREAERGVRAAVGPSTRPAGEFQTTTRPGRTVERADGVAADVTPLRARNVRQADGTHQLFEVGRQRIADEYRDYLKAYYESVATTRPAVPKR